MFITSLNHPPPRPRAPKPPEEVESGQERRRSPRETLVAEARIRPQRVGGIAIDGYASNISELGVGLHTSSPLQIGEQFRVSLKAGPMRLTSKVRVVSCRKDETGVYDIGAEFVIRPQEPEEEIYYANAA